MVPTKSKVTNEAQIRRIIENWAKAICDKDINRRLTNYAPDVLLFDVVNPLQYNGSDAVRKRAEEWFSSFQGPIGFEQRNLSITASDDVAVSHSLNRVNATKTDGQKIDMWWRSTICFRKIDGEWMVTHEHNSVPFDVNTGKASLDLKP
jgi:uncharacterized protein (TIGR02246 family)